MIYVIHDANEQLKSVGINFVVADNYGVVAMFKLKEHAQKYIEGLCT